ncbi:MAG TPA: MFS transporter [Dehalococcoidia bacterium]|mgnify:CR=1 FL=1|nr:MFS transporter [Dehalococcoidia bacterium]HIN23312.1 MFS transporter [Dehalococcoidia bacterium]
MAEAVDPRSTTSPEYQRTKDPVMATTVIGAHALEHMYGRAFLVLIPQIYITLGLAPIQAGLLDAVRQLSGGATSMTGGFFVDMFQHRRAHILAFSMGLIAVGYFLVSIAPTYGLILAALAVASAGTALWHPPALGLLAQRFPQQRGLFISLHRSTGNIGDWLGPLIVGGLLAVVGWRWIVGGGTPVLLAFAVVIFFLLRNVGGPKIEGVDYKAKFRTQVRDMRESFRGTGMWWIFTVSAVRGMGDRSLLWVIPLYLTDQLELSSFWVGFHVALLAAPGIFVGPMFGALSDKIGRKPIIIFIMASAVIFPTTMALGGDGLGMTISVLFFGVFLFSVNSLTQAAAIDVASGKGLEGTFIGLMWGSNAFFGAMASIISGVIVEYIGWHAAFYFASGLFFLGFLSSLALPGDFIKRERQPA